MIPHSESSKISAKTFFWTMEVPEVFGALQSRESGLSEEEARSRRAFFGKNEIADTRSFSRLALVMCQIKSPLILVLIAAACVTLFFREWIEAGVIFAAVLVNTTLGFWQENKAENALGILKTYIRTRVRVTRSGKKREIDASELVPGDIIHVSQGDRIPADARLFFAKNLQVDEAVLTGESLPDAKSARALPPETALGDRACMVFGGTVVIEGFGEAIVAHTGGATEFGRIAALVAAREAERTPLQRALRRFVMYAGAGLAPLVAALFLLGVYTGYSLFDMFLISVAVAVSAVPEGLPIALTVILAVGVERLAARRGVVRKLLAAETLGSATLILTDKTGTLTQAQMELREALPYGGATDDAAGMLAKALGNIDVVIENPEQTPQEWKIVGRGIEAALARGAAQRGVLLPRVIKDRVIADRLPFSSEYKFSATVAHAGSRHELALFGAPEILLEFTRLDEDEREAVRKDVAIRAARGERILGVASKEVPEGYTIGHTRAFDSLEFDGLLAFRDPLRPGVAGAIKRIGEAGVATIIVTGDHRGTAEAVARELGMMGERNIVLTGDDLKNLSGEEQEARADRVAVYARVTPEDKINITRMYQAKGEIVAVTGDGVNDAPALRQADIGIAVGSGTDVTKSAADLIILDDNFETIVAAIEEGRKVLDNIRKVIVYLLSDALDELLLIGGAFAFGLPLPLSALQILFVNFFSDSFPAIALAFEQDIDGLGKKPRTLNKNLFDREMKFFILFVGTLTSALLFGLYWHLLRQGFPEDIVRTFIFASFATYTLFLAFSVRSLEKSMFEYNLFSNIYLVVGSGVGLILTACAVYLPFFQNIFGTVSLSGFWLFGVLGVGAANIAAIEAGKWLFRKGIL